MAHDLGFFYIFTCHLKAPTSGPPHERGGAVQSAQFRGSRAMIESTYYLLGIERNKDPMLPEAERNTSHMVLLEDRNFGNVCRIKVVYDPHTQSYREPTTVF
jgi:twinkle protein